MKIQNINLFANRVINNNQVNKNQFYKINQLQADIVSFSGKPAETSSIVKAKIEAEKVQQRAAEIKNQSEEYAIEGYDVLEETKQSFMQALKYIDMARMAVANDTVNFEMSDGRSLNFISVIKNGKPQPLMIKVYDKGEKNIQNIMVKDFVPSHIEEFNDDGTFRSMDFNGNSIVVLDDVAPTEGNKIGLMYVYNNGLLMAVRKNRKLFVQPMVDEKCFYYNEQGDLWLAEENTQMYLIGKRVVEDRYNFQNGKLFNYYSGFTKSPNDLMSWDESYHYDQYKFIGATQNVKQPAKGKPPMAEKTIYLDKTRKFLEAENVECKINDFATVEFKEVK